MKQSSVLISGVRFDPITQADLLADIEHRLQRPAKPSFLIMKPYVEFLAAAQRDARYAELINQADRVVADGVAIQWAASYLHGQTGLGRFVKSLLVDIQRSSWRQRVIPERGAGVNATRQLLERAEKSGWRVGIVGGPRDTVATDRALLERFPHLQLKTVESGYFAPTDEPALIRRLQKHRVDILFVALGFPKQEEFMVRNRERGISQILIGEGGTFDFDEMGGPLKRAPKAVRRVGMEWLWRLFQQPSRAGRQASIPRFLGSIYREGKEK